MRVTLNGIGAEPSVRCAQYHLSRRPAGERGRVQPARFTDGMHCMRRGSHPPYPTFARGGKVGVWSFSPLAKGGHRGVLRVPPRCTGSAPRRLKTALTQSRSDETNFSFPFAEDASLLETEGVTLTAAHNESDRRCERYLTCPQAERLSRQIDFSLEFCILSGARHTGSQIALLAIETPGATRGHRGKWIMS